MRTGRPSKELNSVLDWLKAYLSRGPVLVSQLVMNAPVSWGTTLRAKRALNIKSKKTPDGWFWYIPDVNDDADARIIFNHSQPKSEQISAPVQDAPAKPTEEEIAERRAEKQARMKLDSRKQVVGAIKLWLEPNPEAVLEAHTYSEIEIIKNTMRMSLPLEQIEHLIKLARVIQKRKLPNTVAVSAAEPV
jgi:hypothetical protein